ncbi:MAG: sugar phosphate nucleotidyltransferase [Candidatus Electryonea clarkiae]|nr:sugar phosphate nucleotidyltransferase [Candidatus Electryonea clarkiae]MDP8286900.1 sugar phosphate nucleotidyltransferase [Candidatus Electryonea clarkiae]
MKQIRAIIPAAGIGKRMRPLTNSRPKVLLPIAGKPIIGHLIDELVQVGIEHITVVIGYYGEKVKDFCRDAFPEVSFRFVTQEQRLGLGHAIGEAIQPDDKKLIVVLGDTIYKGDLDKFNGDDAVLGLVKVDDPRRFGIAIIENDKIVRLEEKPENPVSNLILAGIYYFPEGGVIKNAINTLIEKDIRTRNEYQITDAMQLMIEDGYSFRPVMIDGWYECGVPESLIETNQILLRENPKLRNMPEKLRKNNIIIDPVYIEDSVESEYSIIGPHVHLSAGCKISRSILLNTLVYDNAVLEGVSLEGAVIGNDTLMIRKDH